MSLLRSYSVKERASGIVATLEPGARFSVLTLTGPQRSVAGPGPQADSRGALGLQLQVGQFTVAVGQRHRSADERHYGTNPPLCYASP